MNFLTKNDGSGRRLRPVQIEALTWLQDNWNNAEAFVLQIPVGGGKSLLAKSIANATNGHIITPSNILVNQYRDVYPTTNFLQGKSHYTCSSGLSCEDWTGPVLEQKPCPNCPYVECKKKALQGQQTIFNPLSLYYAALNKEWRTPNTLIVDESHQLGSMISMLSGTRLRRSMYKFTEETTNELVLLPWLNEQLTQLAKLATYYGKDKKRLKEIVEELERLRLVKLGIEHDAANYAIWIERGTFRGKADQFLCIKPVRPPRKIVQGFLDSKKVVLLSGTTTPADVFDLVGDRRTLSIDLPSPIPKENRMVIYKPASFPMNVSTDPKRIVQTIESIIADNPGLNTIIHVSYSMSKRLQPHFTIPNLIYNDAENKSKKLLQFTTQGGIFLAAGCSEGLDLRGDLCRLNIIPKLLYPNLGDPVVQKRKSLEDGDAWYASETLKTLVQQTGRSTRSETDYSKIFVLDPGFARIFRQHKGSLPGSFIDSISWSGK